MATTNIYNLTSQKHCAGDVLTLKIFGIILQKKVFPCEFRKNVSEKLL